MGTKTVAEWVGENLDDVMRLVGMGIFPTTLLTNYKNYVCFKNLGVESRMEAYEHTAIIMRSSAMTIRRSVKIMEKPI